LGCVLLMAAALCSAEVSKSTDQKTASSSVHSSKHTHKKSRKTARRRGQQKIDAERARQIQDALIREHYLSGKPSGVWDSATQAAMQKYQADNGWQAKTTPDSRALIKLGLGPDQEHLLNPESAMTTRPQPRTVPASTAGPTDPAAATQPQK
jgi:peptidoglycan hydrolase-like protein with peptidoglycan-binding domain